MERRSNRKPRRIEVPVCKLPIAYWLIGFTFAQISTMIKWITACLIGTVALAACSPNNVTVDNSLKKYFDQNKVTGCFGLFDNGQGSFTIYNVPRFRDSAYLPA